MAFRRKSRDESGRVVESDIYYIDVPMVTDAMRRAVKGSCLRLPGFRDKAATDELGRRVQKLVVLRATGGEPRPELREWINGLPVKVRDKLAMAGLIDERSQQALHFFFDSAAGASGASSGAAGICTASTSRRLTLRTSTDCFPPAKAM